MNVPLQGTTDLIPGLPQDPGQLLELLPHYGPGVTIGVLAGASVVAVARWTVWRWRNTRLGPGARIIEIAVPPKVEDGSAAAWWAHLIGLTLPAWKRVLFGQPHLAFEYLADHTGVRFQVWVPGTIPPGLVEKTIRSAWPGATLTTRAATAPLPVDAQAAGGRLVLGRAEHFPLTHTHDSDPLRGLLGTASGLADGEHLAVQILARPATGRRLRRAHRAAAALRGARSTAPQAALFDLLTPGMTGRPEPADLARQFPERAEQVRAILGKAAQPRFEAAIRYGVATRHPDQAEAGWLRAHAHEVASTFALFTSGHQHLRRQRLRRPAVRLADRRLHRGFLLSVRELAALAHLPYDLAAPGVTRAGARPVAPSPAVPVSGPGVRVLGDSEAGAPRPVGLTVAGARQHLHVLGQTGVGKSTFLANLILSDAAAGRGALVIDPKGDLITDVLDRLPDRAIDRTVLFDPADRGRPPCLNVLAGADPAFAAESIVTTFRRCFSSSWGPRLDDLLRSACLTLTRVNGTRATLADIPRLLVDTPYRARVTARLEDELLRGFWASYDELTPAARASVIGPVMNKLRAVLLRPFVRDTLSGGTSTIDLGGMLGSGSLILARLPKGVLGEDAVRLLGSLLLAHTWQAITPRATQAEDERRDAAAYIDEAHNFLNLPGSISDILAEARAYRFSLTLAHQHLSQLPKDLRDAVSADARNKIYFAASPEDATDLARHTAPLLGPHDLSHLGAYQAAARLMDGNTPTPPFTFRTRPLPEKTTGRATAVRRASREQFVTGRGKRSIPAVGLRDLDGEPSPPAWTAATDDSADSAQQPPSRKDSL
ncbi:type IV secretory system conjugative DNA transfer family protein [Actinomadura sp. 3N508]|uniref:type IV secretory system conjugative DNA transfer family protein n=1 Tax=Actinomadura sp. 3N508 TaxID=3375153 RepID=UPI0037A34792